MTNDQQRAMINRIAYALLDTIEGKNVTKEFKKLYSGTTGAKNVDKKIRDLDAIGLPNIKDNVIEDGNIKSEFMTSKSYTIEVNGETQTQISEEPDNDKMSEIINRATAITYTYALFIELNRVQDELDDHENKIKTLEDKIRTLESDISLLKMKFP